MSDRYPGGIISKTAPTPTGPYESSTAPGIWSLEQQMQYQQQGIWPTAGLQPNYIEDVFSTYLYTGNDSVQGISNGIALGTTYGGSGYFGGASATSGLTAPASTSWEFTGDYTVEAWIYVVTLANGTIYATGGSGAADQFTYTTAGELYFANQGTGTGVITAGSWIHVAAARSGTTQKIFINGVAQSTTTVSGTIGQNATAYIGRRVDSTNYVTGYISNLRVVKGTAVYTSNFTPSTVPLTAISGTVLLTCQANGFVDASTNAFTITNTNAIAITNYGPFTSTTAGKGGLVWIKARNTSGATRNHRLWTTNLGGSGVLQSDSTAALYDYGSPQVTFNSSGFGLSSDAGINATSSNYVSWTFAEQPKFFDIVTWTGNYPTNYPRVISHNLGSTPGCVIIKCTSNVGSWGVWHRSISTGDYNANDTLYLNSTAASVVYGNVAGPFTSTTITVGEDLNQSGRTYVAYLFAHNAGGFGLTGTDNVISCGSYTGNGSANGPVVNLGYEPQWVLTKGASSGAAYNWAIVDNMRGIPMSGNTQYLFPNDSGAESAWQANGMQLSATGFQVTSPYSGVNASGETYIYIAIRRGPMKVPTSGTSVYNTVGGSGANPAYVAGFPVDLALRRYPGATQGNKFYSRLTGTTYLDSTSTAAEVTDANGKFDYQNAWFSNPDGAGYYSWMWKRAPSFFDEVCWSTTGSAQTINHNLGVVPELMIRKVRNGTWESWMVYAAPIGNTKILYLDQTAGQDTNNGWNNQTPTATQFFVNNTLSGYTMVTYLFATCAGVSKVGSYTGTGATQTVNCGFGAGGSRFVLIKRTDSTGDWYVWDSARGMVSGTDPSLLLNSTAAEVNANSIYTISTGFQIVSTAAGINASGGTYIYLAIA